MKHAESNGSIIYIRCYSHSMTNGKVRRTKRYTARTVDWIAAYEPVTDRCYYVPSAEFETGRTVLHLRLVPTLNNQRARVRMASEYLYFGPTPRHSEP